MHRLSEIAAIVLAAGFSSRMGSKNKLTEKLNDTTVLGTVLNHLPVNDLTKVVVVTGHESENIENIAIGHSVECIANAHFAHGMSTSIVSGLQALLSSGHPPSACMICLGDMPFLTKEDYAYIGRNFVDAQAECLIPTWNGQTGHPVVFSANCFPALLNLTPEDKGARSVIQTMAQNRITYLPMSSDNCLRDLDTPADFNRLKRHQG